MYYFVPAWYNAHRMWYCKTEEWFHVLECMTFDDTVNHVKLFQQQDEHVCLLLLNYQPQLRYELHKNGLLGVSYYSFFDDIQNISRTTTQTVFYQQLNWQKGTEFIYTPFAIVAKTDNVVTAIIHFAENGNLLSIDFQKDQTQSEKHIYDDRGFLSSVCYFEDGHPVYQEYLNERGIWQVRENLVNSRITVNAQSDSTFQKSEYATWEELMQERMAVFNEKRVSYHDKIVIASHPQHNQLLLDSFADNKKVFSFFGQREQILPTELFVDTVKQATLLITDTKKQENTLKVALEQLGMKAQMLRLAPFDTRLRLGHSQMVKELTIYFYVDTIEEHKLKQALLIILKVMNDNPLIRLQLVSFQQHIDFNQLKVWTVEQISAHFDKQNFVKAVPVGENKLEDENELVLYRLSFEYFSSENQIIEALDKARLVIDLGNEPDSYTQIASISAGVPQIHRVESDFVEHLKNGWILDSEIALEEAIHYYFDSLSNWNEALVYAVQKMADYTSGRLLEEWKAILEEE